MNCAGKKKEPKEVQPPPQDQYGQFETGKILNHISCLNDSSQSYALYLPKSYNINKKYPVIYAFDASARGSLALKQYSALAEKYNYILIGSNNSRNNLDWGIINNIITNLFNDSQKRIAIDPKRIYTTGFSGGARVATSAAMENPGICGVMSCAAGFPSLDKPLKNYFNYVGMVGESDFNYRELHEVDKTLESVPMRHILLTFSGKHDWAPSAIFEEAILFNEFNAMKDKLIPINDSLVNQFIKKEDAKIKSINNAYEQFLEYRKITIFLDGLTDLSSCKSKMDLLGKSPDYKNFSVYVEKLGTEEANMQTENMNALSTKNMDWWKTRVNFLKNMSNTGEAYKKQMYKRVLNHLGLLAHLSYDNALKNNSNEQALFFLNLKEMVQPEEAICSYLFASFYARNHELEKAYGYLEKSVNMGFDDIYRISSDENISLLKTDPRFPEILKRIIANAQ